MESATNVTLNLDIGSVDKIIYVIFNLQWKNRREQILKAATSKENSIAPARQQVLLGN